MADVKAIEHLLCERYNVPSVEGLGPFAEAVRLARIGNLGPLRQAVRARDMYRWGTAIEAALDAPDPTDPTEGETVTEEPPAAEETNQEAPPAAEGETVTEEAPNADQPSKPRRAGVRGAAHGVPGGAGVGHPPSRG